MRLIDADRIKLRFSSGVDGDGILFVPYRDVVKSIQLAPTVDAVPVTALLELRDSLYFGDQITMRGLKKLNQLIAKYDSRVKEAKDGR